MVRNILEYKGFCGSIEYTEEDGCFFGKVIGISDLVTFEAESLEGLKHAFVEMVEDYILHCEEIGKEPQRTFVTEAVQA